MAGIQWHVPNGVTAYGIQFHPESFMSIGLEILRDNWLSMALSNNTRPQESRGDAQLDDAIDQLGVLNASR